MDIYTHVFESLCCTSETTTTWEINYISTEKKIKVENEEDRIREWCLYTTYISHKQYIKYCALLLGSQKETLEKHSHPLRKEYGGAVLETYAVITAECCTLSSYDIFSSALFCFPL